MTVMPFFPTCLQFKVVKISSISILFSNWSSLVLEISANYMLRETKDWASVHRKITYSGTALHDKRLKYGRNES